METNSFIFPNEGNSITQTDVKSATLRITTNFKSYFPDFKTSIKIHLNNQIFEVLYSPRDGRSDRLHLGKEIFSLLNIEENKK